MPKCVKCNGMFPPNYVDIIEGSLPDKDNEYPKQCVFCKLGVTEVERESKHNSGLWQKYTQDECLKDYTEFLKKLNDSKNVKEILKKAENSPRIG